MMELRIVHCSLCIVASHILDVISVEMIDQNKTRPKCNSVTTVLVLHFAVYEKLICI